MFPGRVVRSLIAFLVLFALFGLLRSGILTSSDIDLSIVQYILFLPFILLAWSILRTRLLIATPLFVGVLCAGGVAALYAFSLATTEQTPFILAKFSGDEFEKQTMIFREELNERLREIGGHPVGRFYRDVQEGEDLPTLVGEVGSLGMATGDASYLTFHFFARKGRKPHSYSFPHPWGGEPLRLKLIRYVPRLYVPLDPKKRTIEYLAHLLSAEAPLRSDELQFRELSLRAAGGEWGAWASGAHLAYPWWLLGNDYLQQALSATSLEKGTLRCAEDSYGRASSLLRAFDNPHLRAAVFQNKALILAARGTRKGERDSLKEAKQLLRNARNFLIRASKTQDVKAELRVVKGNLARLEELLEISRVSGEEH
ncbi:MAG: hypothetical protein KDD60_02610 [Bdellovibrionales bacterium]|nr:hypothetical protein [Bdellovibrionales bacterium]